MIQLLNFVYHMIHVSSYAHVYVENKVSIVTYSSVWIYMK